MWIENLMWILIGSYAVFTLGLWRVWKRIAQWTHDGISWEEATSGDIIWATVIIPVRNEAENIENLLTDLERQSLPYHLFEIRVVDDASTDGTPDLVNAFSQRSGLNLHLLQLDDDHTASPKKRAISAAITEAQGRLIITTDGDCRVGEDWLSAMVSFYLETGAKCISAPVTFAEEEGLTDFLQTVEFSSLVGSGACAIAIKHPNMCNGANFAYEKSVFEQVGGFEGVEHIASGDDEFLLHKIAVKYPEGIFFLKSPEAIVKTAPHSTWSGFVRQRRRWAGKWKHYTRRSPKVLAIFIFLSNAALLIAGTLWATEILSAHVFFSFLLLKALPEWLFIGSVLRFLKKERALIFIPLVQLIYPLYVVYFGLLGQQSSYLWKGRQLK